jgi:hypothetical protein
MTPYYPPTGKSGAKHFQVRKNRFQIVRAIRQETVPDTFYPPVLLHSFFQETFFGELLSLEFTGGPAQTT